MSSLGIAEKRLFEDILDMGSGYVFDFSDNTFHEFFETVLGIDIFDEKYNLNSGSKANRMRAFWNTESDKNVGKALSEIIQLIELGDKYDDKKVEKAKTIVQRLLGGTAKISHTEDDLEGIWEPGKLRVFISHRDKHKKDAMALGKNLEILGISSFVAHESITPTTKWKDEIHKGLETMDACIAFLTSDFYDSEWTNQELGYALSRQVPVFLYSVDGTDPKGFHFDIQAIKKGESVLMSHLKKKFKGHDCVKNSLLKNFYSAVDGSFNNAKNALIRIIGLELSNSEVEKIVESIQGSAKYINQLQVLLQNESLSDDLKKQFRFQENTYRDLLINKILNQHSDNRFSIEVDSDSRGKIINKE
ncbi:MAG: toll/interleukin-1 receptor domain-containing protein [Halobacteriovoraceae bacterium]|jgi:hypothetical protein|nr:toll/interleukin-1 receptor domain-containing protein [Halobacteriovoraceae bacterium]